MIPSGAADVEDTYAKMSRQATSSMITLQQTGAGRVSPGEAILDVNKKGLVFIIDNSASVSTKINEFNYMFIYRYIGIVKLIDCNYNKFFFIQFYC